MAPLRKAQQNTSILGTSQPIDQTPKPAPKPRAMITQRQKQALMDNLQLEITERARKLRAQSALQTQSLHTRIELRVNRIPTSLRNVTMGELLEKHAAPASSEAPKATASKRAVQAALSTITQSSTGQREHPAPAASAAVAPRGVKRPSNHLDEDKENTPGLNEAVANPKKRTKPDPERRAPNPATVLSPKSSNARAVPKSPERTKPASAQNQAKPPSRAASPLKPASHMKPTAASASNPTGSTARGAKPVANSSSTRSRAPAKMATNPEVKPYVARTKRGLAVAGNRAVSSASSNTSGVSAGTTIVKKVGRALTSSKTAAGIATKKPTPVTGTVRKTAGATAAAPAKRTLRKRA